MLKFEDFKKVEIRIGEIVDAEKIADTDKLVKLLVDIGESDPRHIISGIAEYFPNTEELKGRQVAVVANLEPKVIRGFESHGMILAVSDDEGLALIAPERRTKPGSEVK